MSILDLQKSAAALFSWLRPSENEIKQLTSVVGNVRYCYKLTSTPDFIIFQVTGRSVTVSHGIKIDMV